MLSSTQLQSYIAGFADGDASICIGKCNGGFQLKIDFTQCNKAFLVDLNGYFNGQGRLYTDLRKCKYTREQASSLRFCGIKAFPVLELMKTNAIIKAEQAKYAIQFLSLINKQDKYDEKESFYKKMKELNANKQSYTKDYSRINEAYIAGLFDAEGNVYCAFKNRLKFYVKITQKSDPMLLVHIRDYLGFGNIPQSEQFRLKFHSKPNIQSFYETVSNHSCIKKENLKHLLQQINST